VKPDETRLGIGIAASLLINATVIVPGLASDLSMGKQTPMRGEVVRPPEFEPEQDREPEVKLGIDQSEASTLTWIGYEQYQEHMARLATLEQARFDMGGGTPGGGGSPSPPTLQTTADAAREQSAAPAEELAPTEKLRQQPEPLPETTPLPERPDEALPQASDTAGEAKAKEPARNPDPKPSPAAQPSEPTPQAKPAREVTPTPPKQPPPGENAPSPGQLADTPGTASPGTEDLPPVDRPSKRQSHATAKTQVNVKKWGGPVAAEGLTVNTRNLSLTAFEEMQFRNVLHMTVLLDFGPDGKVARVWIERINPKTKKPFWDPSKTATGYESKVVSSLFGWRAEGDRLKTIEHEKTISIPFNLVYR
jgi:hypothetical protein